MGYEAVEFAGYGGIEAKEMKQKLDQLGLEAVSSHVPMHLLETELERQIELQPGNRCEVYHVSLSGFQYVFRR